MRCRVANEPTNPRHSLHLFTNTFLIDQTTVTGLESALLLKVISYRDFLYVFWRVLNRVCITRL